VSCAVDDLGKFGTLFFLLDKLVHKTAKLELT